MDFVQSYILIPVIALAIVMIVLAVTKKKARKPIPRLIFFVFLLIIAGVIFRGNKLTSYSLMRAGVILAIIVVVVIIKNRKKLRVKKN
ncbi:MAG: hypothetical protein ABIF89_00730 [bacterium]